MPRYWFCAVVLCSAGAASAQSAAVPQESLRDTVLENRLHVIVIPNHTTPVTTLEVVIRAGAFTQVDPGSEGLPHVLEHLLFKTYGRGEGFGVDATDAGASYNGTTAEETVTYYVTLPSSEAKRGIELLADLLGDPSFSRRALDEERLVVRGELERLQSDPYDLLDVAADKVLWGPAFRRKNGIGNLDAILGVDVGRLRDHYRKYYLPNNAALVVSGDVDVRDVFEWARDRFRGWEAGPDPFDDVEPLGIEPLSRDTAFVVDASSVDVALVVKWQGPSVPDDLSGALAADVFSELFNASTSGAQRRLVDTGLFQTVSLAYETLDHVGPIRLFARTTPGMLRSALAQLSAELARLADPSYFGEEDLAAAKKGLRVSSAITRESVPSAAYSLAALWSIGGLDFYRTYERGLQNVTSGQVLEYLERYMIDRPKVIAVLAPADRRREVSVVVDDVLREWR